MLQLPPTNVLEECGSYCILRLSGGELDRARARVGAGTIAKTCYQAGRSAVVEHTGIDVDEFSKRWVAYAVGPRPKIVVAMDWTDFDADNQATIMLSLVSRHGRSTPLVWLTVDKATLK